MNSESVIPREFLARVSEALSEESDRACVILAASWIDHFLTLKLKQEFSKGNARARKDLFSSGGPFASFSTKLKVVYCADWIEHDVFHDLNVIRKLRNGFAHSIDNHSLQDPKFSELVRKLRVPKREYYDWGDLRGASTKDDGLILYSGEKPEDAGEDSDLSQLTFRMAASVIVAVVVSNLGISVDYGGDEGTVPFELREHMRDPVD